MTAVTLHLQLNKKIIHNILFFLRRYFVVWITLALSIISIYCYLNFYHNGLGLAYNDARSRLDIGRRVVEGLKPGLAQLGSVWLPLPHALMIPTVWNDFMWHSGLSGALESMILINKIIRGSSINFLFFTNANTPIAKSGL